MNMNEESQQKFLVEGSSSGFIPEASAESLLDKDSNPAYERVIFYDQ